MYSSIFRLQTSTKSCSYIVCIVVSENSISFGSCDISPPTGLITAGGGDIGAETLPSDWSELAVGGEPTAANSPISGSLGGEMGRAKSLFWNRCCDDVIGVSCDPVLDTPPPPPPPWLCCWGLASEENISLTTFFICFWVC